MPDLTLLVQALQGSAAVIASASVFALALRRTIPAIKAHAAVSSWKAETGLAEAYATFVTGFASACSGAQWLLDHVALNTTKGQPK